jgi:flavodoxin
MSIAVTYFSRTGNTKKVAEAIAVAAGCVAQSIADYDVRTPVDLLFIGGSIYGGRLEPALSAFIGSLDPAKVARAVVFGTHAAVEASGVANSLVKETLKARGIAVEEACFSCKGKFLFVNRKYPTGEALDDARQFAAGILNKDS